MQIGRPIPRPRLYLFPFIRPDAILRCMKISVVALGSRGDVEPFVALALGLQAAGHEVNVGAGSDFESFVTSRGLAFKAAGGDMQKALSSSEGKAFFKSKNPVTFVRRLRSAAEPVLDTMQEDLLAATAGSDACVFSYLCGPVVDIHEATGLIAFMGLLISTAPTLEFPIRKRPANHIL